MLIEVTQGARSPGSKPDKTCFHGRDAAAHRPGESSKEVLLKGFTAVFGGGAASHLLNIRSS